MAQNADIFKARGMGVFNNVDTPALITVTSAAGGDSMNIMVTAFSGQAAESYQALKSFTEAVYITLFGQALSMFTLNCVSMPEDEICDDAKVNLDNLQNIYKYNRIGAAAHPILTITLDGMTIKGFLVAMPIGTKSTSGINSIAFTLNILGQVIL